MGCNDYPSAGACLLRAMRAAEPYNVCLLRALRHVWRTSAEADPIRANLAQLLHRRSRAQGTANLRSSHF